MTVDSQATPQANSALTPWSPPLLKLTIGGVVTVVASAFGSFAVATMMPRTVEDLGGLPYYGWTFSAYMLANIVGLTIAGSESDRVGPGRPYVVGTLCFCAGLLIGGFASSMLMFIIGRAVQGFGGGLFGSSVYVVVGRIYPESAKPRMLALLSSSGIIPALIGPALAGAIADYLNWRAVFFAIVPFMVIAVSMTYPRIRTIGPGTAGGRPNWRRFIDATALAAGSTLLIAGLGSSTAQFAIPAVAVGIVVIYRMASRLMPAGTLWLAAGLPAGIAVMALISLGYFGVDAFVPLGLTDIRNRSASFAGLALTFAALAWSGANWIQVYYSDKRSRRQIVRIGLVLIGIATIGMTASLFPSVPIGVALLAWAISGLGMGLAYSGVSLTIFQLAERGREGAATSSMQIAFVLGTALGAGIGGAWLSALSDGEHANRSSLLGQNALMIALLLVAFLAVQRIPAWPGQERSTEPHALPN